MKKVLFAVLGGVAIIGCQEKAPNIVLEKKAVVDSPYFVSAIPATTPHMILVEEFTGQTCSNCPKAHDLLEKLKETYGNVIVMGLYKYNHGLTTPPVGALYDFRDSTATVIADNIYNSIPQLPTAGVDRVPVSGSNKLGSGDWETVIKSRVDMADSLNLSVSSSYNAADKEISVSADIVYTKTVTNPQNLSIAILEDSMIDKQDVPAFPPSGFPDDVDPAYLFTNVFRGTITAAPHGDPILPGTATKTPGTALKRTYIYKLKSNIVNPKNCRVVAYVTNNFAGGTIVKAAQTRMKP